MRPRSAAPGLVIAAAHSGAGKTTLTVGLLRALHRRGVDVAPAKCGPDFIDPGLHALAAGRPSVNLDGWGMRPAVLDAVRARVEGDAQLVICEGVMGLFDGGTAEPPYTDGSVASLAARTGWPVVLVLDVSAQGQTAAAVAKGLATFRPEVRVAGVILNRIASPGHTALCREAIEAAGVPVVGALPRSDAASLPERHLGLVQAADLDGADARLDAIADHVAAAVDLDRLQALAAPARASAAPPFAVLPPPPGQRIALGRDRAFSFVYPHLIAAWRDAGATVLPFSPLADEAPDASADVCWLPGGYPELHAGALASRARFLSGLRAFARTRPVHGECGGYMVLGESLVDAGGERHAMAGLLALRTTFAERRLRIGYRSARLAAASVLGPAGTRCRGHEFHYASSIGVSADEPLFVDDGVPGVCLGTRRGHVSGSFFHFIDVMD